MHGSRRRGRRSAAARSATMDGQPRNGAASSARHSPMQPYLDFMRHVRDHGHRKDDRTGTGTLSVFGYQMRFDLARGLSAADDQEGPHQVDHPRAPVVPARARPTRAYLKANGVTIWDEWADANGDLGPVYGYQWRSWPAPDGGHIDQIANVLAEIRRNPDSRRLIVSAWNVARHPADEAAAVPRVLPVLRRRTGGCRASSTSAAPTSSWACPSTSPRTRC